MPRLFAQDAVATPSPTSAADSPARAETETERITIVGREDDLLGIATTASQGSVGAQDLEQRPILRRGELLEVVPGLIITQHSGEAKANQYYLRGFNLDHGTDFSVMADGLPINMRTHAHGQGWADPNFVIPELVERIDFFKGPYFPAIGDFSGAGAAEFKFYKQLPRDILTLEYGENDYFRALLAQSIVLRSSGGPATAPPPAKADLSKDAPDSAPLDLPRVLDTLTYALEFTHHNGPFDIAENFQRYNAFLRYYAVRAEDRFTVTAQANYSRVDSPDQIAQRAIEQGFISRLGSLDETVGLNTQRYSLDAEWRRLTSDGTETRAQIYGIYSSLDLFSNFTYFLDDPINGDQFNQADDRFILGGSLAQIWNATVFGRDATFTLGLDTRTDFINDIGLYHTQAREILSAIREDDVLESSAGLFGQTEVIWTSWFRSVLGLRADGYYFDVANHLNPETSGTKTDGIVSPKLSLIFGPFAKTELYLSAGTGFHSNDARGVIGGIDPATGENALPASALARSTGAEVGARTSFIPGLVSSLAFFYLQSDSELVFVGDAGAVEASGATERYGIELNNFYRPFEWLTLDADIALAKGRFTDPGPEGDKIPGAIPLSVAAGVAIDLPNGWFGSLRGRYFGPRPLIEDGSVESNESLIFNARIGYRFKKPEIEVALQVLNVFDADDNDIEYFYASRLQGEPAGGVEDIHLRAVEPRAVR
ncbi:MAG: TonB-dependent receptor plug domain-containing protein, partial [Chthoniobacterales bacterium]|nr:TonB-dependent receptor plug domain-containing protein [Chthoniobacterales bacterium]